MITLRNITLRRGPTVLLEAVNWTIYHKQRIGVVGANGSGKSSLFAMLLGQLAPDLGDLDIPSHLQLSHVAQETPGYSQSALDFVMDGDAELRRLEAELAIAEEKNDGLHMGAIHEKLSIINAYTAPARAAQLLAGLGFKQDEHQNPVSAFSGGWRVRLNLAKALMCRSDLLLLDEPTNHLDLDAICWLEQWLMKYQGTLLLISHDRDFLDRTVNHIAHLHHHHLKVYPGNYSAFESQRAAQLLVQQATYEKQQQRIAHLQSFVDRFRAKASKARQAQSRLKAIARMDLVCAVQTESPFHFEFKAPAYCPNPLISLDNVNAGYGDHIVVHHLNFSIAPKDRIAILGPNGAGKSTFVKLLAGVLPPLSGERHVGANLKIGYFAQHQIDHLALDDSPLEHMREIAPSSADVDLRKYLGSFNFTGDDVFKAVRYFSGGEKTRLALALLIWQRPNLLLLDEPTNHLDLDMRNALSLALQEYEGAMILISHDRFLVRTTTDQLWLISSGQLEEFSGDLIDYQKWLTDFRKESTEEKNVKKLKPETSKKEQREQKAKQRDAIRPLLQKIEKLETQLNQLQQKATDIELQLTDQALYDVNNKQQLQACLQIQAQLKKDIEMTEAEWLSACDEKDNLLA